MIDVGAQADEILQILADNLRPQDGLNDVPRGFRRLARARKEIRVAVALEAAIGYHLDQQAARDGKIVCRCNEWLSIRHFENSGFNLIDFHRVLPRLRERKFDDRQPRMLLTYQASNLLFAVKIVMSFA